MSQPAPRFWDICYTNEITACVTFQGALYDGSRDPGAPFPWNEPTQFIGGWRPDLFTGSEPFRITAWGLKFPGQAQVNWFHRDDAVVSSDPFAFGWSGFSFVNQYTEWDFAVGGPHYEASAWQGYWVDRKVAPLGGTRLAWRGETEDHRLVFDCIQAGPGSSKCHEEAAFNFNIAMTTTATPEPSTLLLLVTGLALWQLARRMRG